MIDAVNIHSMTVEEVGKMGVSGRMLYRAMGYDHRNLGIFHRPLKIIDWIRHGVDKILLFHSTP
jgi:hypothetical protein